MPINHRGRSASPTQKVNRSHGDDGLKQATSTRFPLALVGSFVLGIFWLALTRSGSEAPSELRQLRHVAEAATNKLPSDLDSEWLMPMIFEENVVLDPRMENCVYPSSFLDRDEEDMDVDTSLAKTSKIPSVQKHEKAQVPSQLCSPQNKGFLVFEGGVHRTKPVEPWEETLRLSHGEMKSEAVALPKENFSPYCHHTDVCKQKSWHVMPLMILTEMVRPNLALVPEIAKTMEYMVRHYCN